MYYYFPFSLIQSIAQRIMLKEQHIMMAQFHRGNLSLLVLARNYLGFGIMHDVGGSGYIFFHFSSDFDQFYHPCHA